MHAPFPNLYQLNIRVWLTEESARLGRRATLADLGPAMLEPLAKSGFQWLWPVGVWQVGSFGRQISRGREDLRREYSQALPDLHDDDVAGSPFAVQAYRLNPELGTDEDLAALRDRMRDCGLKLMLDFVPNHTALDHPWVEEHPEYYVLGSIEDWSREPYNYVRLSTRYGERVFAHGRDPYFLGWPDTAQLNYRHGGLRNAMTRELLRAASCCDGLRCDMAMLLLPEVIAKTWGERSKPVDGTEPRDTQFWPDAIAQVHRAYPDFLFLAEVYWDLEYQLQEQGFDFTYDKRLYDRLHGGDAIAVREHLGGPIDFQQQCARFLENHDEPRAAASFPWDVHRAAAILTYFAPGMRFFQDGQFEGRRKRTSIHLRRRADEPADGRVRDFYQKLVELLRDPVYREGKWTIGVCHPAWEGNPTWSRFICFSWEDARGERRLVCVNFGPTQGQCYLRWPWPDVFDTTIRLRDAFGPAGYDRQPEELRAQGLYLDLGPWSYHLFEVHGS